MDFMFWVWLGVIVATAIAEFATMEIVSIWFTIGAIVPFILAATNCVRWEIQLVVFVVISAVLIVSLRRITKKFLLKNSNGKTNLDTLIGKELRMLKGTDFETIGSVKVNDVVWSAVGQNRESIGKDEIVEVVKIDGNKLIVKKIENMEESVSSVKESESLSENKKEKKENKK